MTTVGIIASPAAGKDVRRLVANAGVVGDVDKISVIRRAAMGAVEGGATGFTILDDTRHLVLRALEPLPADIDIDVLDVSLRGSGSDSVRAAEALRKRDIGAVLVFGGDGTNRDVAKGWIDAPVVPLSVGTNNVFPLHTEPTLGGAAAGLVASGQVALVDVASRAKVVHVELADGEDDLALVDVVLVAGDFVGSRAVWDADDIVSAVLALADPASVGLSSIGAMVAPAPRHHDGGVHIHVGDGRGFVVRAPIAPGTYQSVGLEAARRLDLGERVLLTGPGVLAFDGERDHVLESNVSAVARVERSGPWLIDPERVLALAAEAALFITDRRS